VNAAKKIARMRPATPRVVTPRDVTFKISAGTPILCPIMCPSVFGPLPSPLDCLRWTVVRSVGVLLLCLALFTGCAARATTDAAGNTTVEIDTRGGVPTSPPVIASTGTAAATLDAGDATASELLAKVARAAAALDWRGARQAAADFMEWAHSRERGSDPRKGKRPDLGQDRPAVAGVRERADEAFWQELER